MKTMIAIINPKAGRAGGNPLIAKISNRLESQGISVQVIKTGHPGHATQIAREFHAQGHREFLSLGGDGTLFEVINGFFQSAQQPDVRLGVIPTGTGNSFLKDFVTNPDQVLDAIIHGKTKSSDVMKVECASGTVYFINIFSFGFTSQVGMVRNKYFSFMGHSGYTMAVLCKLLNLRSEGFYFKIDGKPMETSSIFISMNNTRFTGGNMMMAPEADPQDGMVDIINAKSMGRLKLLMAFPKIFKGTHLLMPQVESFKARTVEFDFDSEIPVMVDGELLHIHPRRLDVIPRAIQIYA